MHLSCRLAAAAIALLISACGGKPKDEAELPPTCPVMGVLADAALLRIYKEGGGRAAADVAYEVEFMRANLLECEVKDGKMISSIRFEAVARTGPAAAGSSVKFPYFISVLGPDNKPVSKKLYEHQAKFRSGQPLTRFGEEVKKIEIIPPEGKDGEGYEILIGFQLTREQLELNRYREKPRPDVELMR